MPNEKDKMCQAVEADFGAEKVCQKLGSGCGTVGRAVASDLRGPQFESNHRQNFIINIFPVTS